MKMDESGVFMQVPHGLRKYMENHYREWEEIQNKMFKESIMEREEDSEPCCMAKHFQKAKDDIEYLKSIRANVIDGILGTFKAMEILIFRDEVEGHLYNFCKRSLQNSFEFLEECKRDKDYQRIMKECGSDS